jgi:hypothetical protein
VIEIIQWLANFERRVGELYRDAANLFAADKEFSAFLDHLAADEDWHFQVMGSASQSVRKGLEHKSLVSLDDEAKDETESRLLQLQESLADVPPSKRSLLDLADCSCLVRCTH